MAIRAVAIALAIGIAGAEVAAEPRVATGPELGLAWDAPASCPDRAAMRARIERRLGRSLDDVVLGITVDVRARGGRFVATIDLRAVTVANDVRTLTSTRCGELADAVAVIVARVAREAAQRTAQARTAAASSDAVASAATGNAAATDDESPPDHAAACGAHCASPRVAVREQREAVESVAREVLAEPAPRWSLGARLAGISGIGVVPEVGWGTELSAYVRHDSTMVELAEAKWLASSQKIRYGTPARIDVGFGVTAMRVGWRPPVLPLRAWLAVEVGQMNGDGVGVNNAQVGSGRWIAAGSGFGVGWQISRWIRVVGTTEFDIAFERVRFTLDDGVVVYQPAPASARVTLGFELGRQ